MDEESDDGYNQEFEDPFKRRRFIRNVYMVITLQMLITAAFIATFVFVSEVKAWIQQNQWLYYASYGVFLVTYIALSCCSEFRRRSPGNFIALAVFTLAWSFVLASAASYHSASSVLIAVAITAGVCIAVSLFAVQTKIDFTLLSGIIFVAFVVFMLVGLVIAIIKINMVNTENVYIMDCVYGGIGSLLICLVLIVSTQQIFGNRASQLGADEVVFGALQIYFMTTQLFMMILGFFRT